MLAHIIRDPYLKSTNSFEPSGNVSGNFVHTIFFLSVNFHNMLNALYNFRKYSKLWNYVYLTKLQLSIDPAWLTWDQLAGTYLARPLPMGLLIHLSLVIMLKKKKKKQAYVYTLAASHNYTSTVQLPTTCRMGYTLSSKVLWKHCPHNMEFPSFSG